MEVFARGCLQANICSHLTSSHLDQVGQVSQKALRYRIEFSQRHTRFESCRTLLQFINLPCPCVFEARMLFLPNTTGEFSERNLSSFTFGPAILCQISRNTPCPRPVVPLMSRFQTHDRGSCCEMTQRSPTMYGVKVTLPNAPPSHDIPFFNS
jgi:hypothetical protein